MKGWQVCENVTMCDKGGRERDPSMYDTTFFYSKIDLFLGCWFMTDQHSTDEINHNYLCVLLNFDNVTFDFIFMLKSPTLAD